MRSNVPQISLFYCFVRVRCFFLRFFSSHAHHLVLIILFVVLSSSSSFRFRLVLLFTFLLVLLVHASHLILSMCFSLGRPFHERINHFAEYRFTRPPTHHIYYLATEFLLRFHTLITIILFYIFGIFFVAGTNTYAKRSTILRYSLTFIQCSRGRWIYT